MPEDQPQTPEQRRRAEIDAKFVAMGHKPEDTSCNHQHYDRHKHGRYCTCGTIMWDPGD